MKNFLNVSSCYKYVLLLTFLWGSIGCSPRQEPLSDVVDHGLAVSKQQALFMAEKLKGQEGRLPKTVKDGELETSDCYWWCSGFFPGVLWYLYENTPDDNLRAWAELYTQRVEPVQYVTDNHDVGFMLYCSYGNGLRLTGNPGYRNVLITGAHSLATRYNPLIKSIRSWDWNQKVWQYPVIIDNMMNLELLMWASKQTNDSKLSQIALNHANTTLENHFRPDYSTYHVVSYDTITGKPHVKMTQQGYADETSWARGQSWALYGYTMMARETGDTRYLEQAMHIADFLLDHPRMPEDKIPYWDYDDPKISDAPRDASAASIMASALIELSQLVLGEPSTRYYSFACEQIRSLSSPVYLAEPGTNDYFILKHSTGNLPGGQEIDVPLTYADYYYVEALMRLKKILAKRHSAETLSNRSDKVVFYSDYGAVGDGVTDDFEAIIKAHEAANEAGLKVCADAGATYYIGGANKTALIQTDTDWRDARFIINDTNVENRNAQVFAISSKLPSTPLTSVKTLRKNQEKLELTLPYESFIVVNDTTTKRYIRYGPNQNSGSPQTDCFVVDKKGKVDMKAPIIWDFNQISSITAFPIDPEVLTIRGGHFITIANQAESRYTYYSRGMATTRSNVVFDGICHTITGELDHGAPYGGFITISNCTGVTVQNCRLSGHKTYITIGAAGRPVPMGSYDLSVGRSTNVTFRNCKQVNDIHDTNYWGILGSNYSKNITFDSVEFSRFDAHMGVANATIKNSVLGHQGINIIGCGAFLLENTKVCGWTFINLRDDYGSTWEGDLIIRNCEFFPRNGTQSDVVLINGSYSGQHDFGYTCYMPRKITIDGLVVNDSNPVSDYQGPKIFADFNKDYTNEAYKEKYPYVITQEIDIKDLTIKSGNKYLISNNPFMFRNVTIKEK